MKYVVDAKLPSAGGVVIFPATPDSNRPSSTINWTPNDDIIHNPIEYLDSL